MTFHEEQAQKFLGWLDKVRCIGSAFTFWAGSKDFSGKDEDAIFDEVMRIVRDRSIQEPTEKNHLLEKGDA